MKIIDINGEERTILDNPKIITDIRKNDCGKISHENVDGELKHFNNVTEVTVEEKFVEVTIVGNKRNWVEWYPLEKFEKMNPGIQVT